MAVTVKKKKLALKKPAAGEAEPAGHDSDIRSDDGSPVVAAVMTRAGAKARGGASVFDLVCSILFAVTAAALLLVQLAENAAYKGVILEASVGLLP